MESKRITLPKREECREPLSQAEARDIIENLEELMWWLAKKHYKMQNPMQ